MLSLHGLALPTLVLGSFHHKPRPPELRGTGAVRLGAAAPADELVLVTVAQVPKSDAELAAQIVSLVPQLQSVSISIWSPDPLPAPPTSAVFTQALTMTFEGREYQAGNAPDQYESEPHDAVQSLADGRPAARQPILDPTIHNN